MRDFFRGMLEVFLLPFKFWKAKKEVEADDGQRLAAAIGHTMQAEKGEAFCRTCEKVTSQELLTPEKEIGYQKILTWQCECGQKNPHVMGYASNPKEAPGSDTFAHSRL